MTPTTEHLHAVARDVVTRATAIVGLAGIALIHLLDSIGKWGETRYLFWMYIALMAASLVVAGALLHTRDRRAWAASAGLAASAIAGYVLSRTTGLPGAMDDIGNWTEPLGLASLFVEGSVVAVSTYAYATATRAAADIGVVSRPHRRPSREAASAAMR
jgi:hypothetical protein